MGDFFRSASGVIFEIDVPAAGTIARERHDDKLATGDLVAVVGEPHRVDVPGGGYRWEIDAETQPAVVEVDETTVADLDDSPEESAAPIDGDLPDGSVGDVLAWVGADRERAQAALDAEQAESGKGRSSLVRDLLAIIDS